MDTNVNELRRPKAMRALKLCREARGLLAEAGSTKALDKLRKAMPSIEGAVRAADYRDMREAAAGRAQVKDGAR